MASFGSGVSIFDSLVDVNDTNTYTVFLRAGETYDFYMAGDANGNAGYLHDAVLTISGFGFTESDDDGGNGRDADLKFTPALTGNYTLTADAYGVNDATGFYDLIITNTSYESDIPDHIGTMTGTDAQLAVGDALSSTIGSASDSDVVGINLVAGVQYTLTARGASSGDGTLSDPQLALLDSDGHQLLFNDDINGAANRNAQIVFTPGSSGLYYLKVDGFLESTGTYDVDVQGQHNDSVPDGFSTPYNLPLGSSVVGQIDVPFDTDYYAVTLAAGQSYQFGLATAFNGWVPLQDPTLTLWSPAQALLADDSDSGPGDETQITYVAPASGTYFLMASGGLFDVGAYELSGQQLSASPSPVQSVASNQGAGYNELIQGSDHADKLTGGGGNDTIDGGAGNDTMAGGAGNDAYRVGAGDVVTELANGGTDTVDASIGYTVGANVENLNLTGAANVNGAGNGLVNTIYGNGGANLLSGMAGNDTLNGGGGGDTLVGGMGKDLLTGGGGLDHMNYSSLSESGTTFATRDVINTFAHGDKVDVSAIDANGNAAGNQAFTFVDHFSNVAGQLQWDQTAPSGYLIQGDTNGDGQADFSLQIYAAPNFGTIHNWDFIL